MAHIELRQALSRRPLGIDLGKMGVRKADGPLDNLNSGSNVGWTKDSSRDQLFVERAVPIAPTHDKHSVRHS
jgi:hypothetical protein